MILHEGGLSFGMDKLTLTIQMVSEGKPSKPCQALLLFFPRLSHIFCLVVWNMFYVSIFWE
jgi:hypothetical protein